MQNFDHAIGFREKRHFFDENWPKSQKLVIIKSTPGRDSISRPPELAVDAPQRLQSFVCAGGGVLCCALRSKILRDFCHKVYIVRFIGPKPLTHVTNPRR
jgi:hypothetical protein